MMRSSRTELIANRGALPDWLVLNGRMLAAGAALLTLVELSLFLHVLIAPRRSAAVV